MIYSNVVNILKALNFRWTNCRMDGCQKNGWEIYAFFPVRAYENIYYSILNLI